MILSFFKWPPKRFADNPRSKQATPTHVGVQWTERMSNSPALLKAILGCCKANFSPF